MRVVRDDIWLCQDCLFAAIGLDDDEAAEVRMAEIQAGLDSLGPHLVPDFDSEAGEGYLEFAHCGCDCCRSDLAGSFYRFAILGEDSES